MSRSPFHLEIDRERKQKQRGRRIHPSFPLSLNRSQSRRPASGPAGLAVAGPFNCSREEPTVATSSCPLCPSNATETPTSCPAVTAAWVVLEMRLAVPHDLNLDGVEVLDAVAICGVTNRRWRAAERHQLVLQIDLRVGGNVDVQVGDAGGSGATMLLVTSMLSSTVGAATFAAQEISAGRAAGSSRRSSRRWNHGP